MNIEDRRIGSFSITFDVLNMDMEMLRKEIFSKMVILRATTMVEYDAIQYLAICDKFDYCEPGAEPPEYRFLFTKNMPIDSDEYITAEIEKC